MTNRRDRQGNSGWRYRQSRYAERDDGEPPKLLAASGATGDRGGAGIEVALGRQPSGEDHAVRVHLEPD